MKMICIGLLAAAIGCACGQPASATGFLKGKERVVYSFGDSAEANPLSSLLELNGILYGTTARLPYGPGTVFAVDANTGQENWAHDFGSGTDGSFPAAGLIELGGTLYGTTEWGGGPANGGALYAVNPQTGAETVRYSFATKQEPNDGWYPEGGLIDVRGKLYGTTTQGGANACLCGTVFSFDPKTSAEKVLYSFGGSPDGATPASTLINVRGTLYGTTLTGGASGYGTVFSIDPSTGAERVLYSFCAQQACADGETPNPELIHVKGMVYGTTPRGGASNDGTVFSLDPGTGTESVLYSFCSALNCADGMLPAAGVLNVGDVLYGTTSGGGIGTGSDCSLGCGTVFSLNRKTGAEKAKYSFCKQGGTCNDGDGPGAGLIISDGAMYGTTVHGGEYGGGTLFEIINR